MKLHQHKYNDKEIFPELLIFITEWIVWRRDGYPGNSNGNEKMWKQLKNEACMVNKYRNECDNEISISLTSPIPSRKNS